MRRIPSDVHRDGPTRGHRLNRVEKKIDEHLLEVPDITLLPVADRANLNFQRDTGNHDLVLNEGHR